MSKKDTDKKNLTPLSKEEILDTSINDTRMDGIHENDESFFEFVDAKMVENDLKDIESDVAPDAFREKLFGKEKPQKSTASNSILDRLGLLLMPKPAFALVGVVLLLVFLIPTMEEISPDESGVVTDMPKLATEVYNGITRSNNFNFVIFKLIDQTVFITNLYQTDQLEVLIMNLDGKVLSEELIERGDIYTIATSKYSEPQLRFLIQGKGNRHFLLDTTLSIISD